jgi:uncharacterized sulfatase
VRKTTLIPKATELGQQLGAWCQGMLDVGLMPEAEMHRICGRESPYDVVRRDERYAKHLKEAGFFPSDHQSFVPMDDARALEHPSALIRFHRLEVFRSGPPQAEVLKHLPRLLTDESPSVRIAAAEILGKNGSEGQRKKSLAVLLELAPVQKNGVYVSGEALNALSSLGPSAKPGLDVIRKAAEGLEEVEQRVRIMPQRLVEKLVEDLSK